MEPPPPRQLPPKDGVGPRGVPDCYYTSRVLDSTYRYVKFVKKLRAEEEDRERGASNALKDLKDKQYSDFFIRCDRRSLIKKVARRVDLCMTSYQEDLMLKRQRLRDLITVEEEINIRKFVEQGQAGAEALWKDKKDRLAFLLAKRQKEHEDKYSALPISKIVHVHPCIVAKRTEEALHIQQYQMKENQARKMAEIEIDKMWHEVSMKESEALAARMEMDAIVRLRQDHECKQYGDGQVAMKIEQRKKAQEILKQEAAKMKELIDEENRKEEADARKQQEKRVEANRDLKQMIKERQATLAKQKADVQLINDTWDSLAGVLLNEEQAKVERRKQKERELDICNKELATVKNDKPKMEAADKIVRKEMNQRRLDQIDKQRCLFLSKSKEATKTTRAGLLEQIKDNAAARELKAKENADYVEYEKQMSEHLEKLVAHKEMTEKQAQHLFRKQLLEQMEYNNLLKERAKEEQNKHMKKYELAAEQYQREIQNMLCRKFYCDSIHPFMKEMSSDLQMRVKCPCSGPDYCAVPVVVPKVSLKGAPTASTSK